ncbi:DUF4350 domain-containing protein [Haloarcula montana]|uniref:DUF4350 domain-containing protein n=1 Tax=Haloarcula montana TaxID=3111776 RepID=UPI002D76E99F|nr:DUF4350 domain-containing protein [Haloarcula sp. GH36]
MDWTDYPRVALVVLLVLTNLGLVVAMSTSGVAYGPYNADWNGGAELRETTQAAGAAPQLARTTDPYIETRGEGVAFILAPTTEYNARDAARVRQFASSGGTVVVAGENGSPNATNRLLAGLDVETRLNGTLVLDEQNNYRNASLPVATNVSDHPLVAETDGLTLNRGTVLDVPDREFGTDQRDVQVLVRTTEASYLDRNRNYTLDDEEPIGSYPVATVEPVGQGRVVVVSDASVFTNSMLDREGNAAFVRGVSQNASVALLDYSHRPPLPPLTYALLVVRGTPGLQALIATLALAAIALWSRRPSIPIPATLDRIRGSEPPETTDSLSESDIVAYIRDRHPEWDTDRVERVSQHIIRRRDESE